MKFKLSRILLLAAVGFPLVVAAESPPRPGQGTHGVLTVQGAEADARLEAAASGLRGSLGKTGAVLLPEADVGRRLRPDLQAANEGHPPLAKLEADYAAALKSFADGQEEAGQNLLQYLQKELPFVPDGAPRFRLWLKVQILTAYRLHENSEARVLQQNQATARGLMAEVWKAAPDVAELVKASSPKLFAQGEVPADFVLLGKVPPGRTTLVIRSALADAEVFVQGRDVGTIAKEFGSIELSRIPGDYVITARSRGMGRSVPVAVTLGAKPAEVVLRTFVRADGQSLLRTGAEPNCEALEKAGVQPAQCPAVVAARELRIDTVVEAAVTPGPEPRFSASLFSVADGARRRAADLPLADLRPSDPRLDQLARYLAGGKLEGSDLHQLYPPPPPFWRATRIAGTALGAGAIVLGVMSYGQYKTSNTAYDDAKAMASGGSFNGAEYDSLIAKGDSAKKKGRTYAIAAAGSAVVGSVLFFVF